MKNKKCMTDKYKKLNEYVLNNAYKNFKWGEWDCCLFVVDYLEAITGKDYALLFRGKYDTKEGAYESLKKQGFANIEELCDEYLEIKPLKFAQRGDVVLFEHGEDKCLGLCNGDLSHFLTTNEGIRWIKTRHCLRAWSVKNDN